MFISYHRQLTWKEDVSSRLRKDASLSNKGSSTIRLLKVGLFIKFNTTGNNGRELLGVPRAGDEPGPGVRRPLANWAISVFMLSNIVGTTLTTVCTKASIHCCTYVSFSLANLSTAGSSLALQREGSHRRLILHRSAAHTKAFPRKISGPWDFICTVEGKWVNLLRFGSEYAEHPHRRWQNAVIIHETYTW